MNKRNKWIEEKVEESSKKSKGETKKTFYVGRILKNELKSNDFSYLIAKSKKICNSIVDNFFSNNKKHVTHKYH